MPTIHREGPYRFFFYSGDRDERPHVHVERGTNHAKFWIEPLNLVESRGFGATELRRIERIVAEQAEHILRGWYEYFAD